jgi:hypothetical protein
MVGNREKEERQEWTNSSSKTKLERDLYFPNDTNHLVWAWKVQLVGEYHNIYSSIQLYNWKARRYQVCVANLWV